MSLRQTLRAGAGALAVLSVLVCGALGFLIVAHRIEPGHEWHRMRASFLGTDPIEYQPASRESYLRLAETAEAMLHRDVLEKWFPRSIDTVHGGFHTSFARDWTALPDQEVFSVAQGRMTWIAAQVAMRRPELHDTYLTYARHGAEYIEDVLWDQQYGGFYWSLNETGHVSPQDEGNKQLYGMSFCLFGLASAYQADHDPATLAAAQRAFRWIEQHAHDPKNGGYFEWMRRDGSPMQAAPYDPHTYFAGGDFPIGYKSMNTHIHMLEAYTQLYTVWKDEQLRARLEELLHVVRDKLVVEPGTMNLYYTVDWRAVPDHDSYGHDVEAAYLMIEAARLLDDADERTAQASRMLVDHALLYGWDAAHGGLYRSGSFMSVIDDRSDSDDTLKEWWAQMEALNAFLLMHERYGAQTDVYWKAFQRELQYIRKYQIDTKFGGEYSLVRADGSPVNTFKGSMWKAAYHDGRALLNVSERLRRLAETGPQPTTAGKAR